MPTPTGLFYVNPSDDQSTFASKFNYNMDLIWTLGGGPQGLQGLIGNQGVPGPAGIQGIQGIQGTAGTHWYVQNTDPISYGPILPAPNQGDFWLDTSTQQIWAFTGSPASWSINSTLNVSTVFKYAQYNNNHIVFDSPDDTRKLVLSPIDYSSSGGALIQDAPPFKLKIIGNPGESLIRYGIKTASGSENTASTQSYTLVTEVSAGTEYTWETINQTGDIILRANGTGLALKKQISNVSAYEYNDSAFKIQLGPDNRTISFFDGVPSAFALHFGPHNVITTASDRFMSIFDNKTVAIGDISLAVPGDTGLRRFEIIADSVGSAASADSKIFRFRTGSSGSSSFNGLTLRNVRNFADATVNAYKSIETRLEGRIDDSAAHFISFGSGAKDNTQPTTYHLRFGYGATANAGYYYGATDTGRSIFAADSTIKDYTGGASTDLIKAKVTMQPAQSGSMSGLDATSTLHFLPPTGLPFNTISALTGGYNAQQTLGAYAFEFLNTSGGGSSLNLHMGAGSSSTNGVRSMYSILWNSNNRWWNYSDATKSLLLEPGARWIGTTQYPNDLMVFNNIGTESESVVWQEMPTVTTGVGDGFFGIGEQFSETYQITSGGGDQNVYTGYTYKTIAGTVLGQSFGAYPTNAIWKASSNTAFSSGGVTSVALGQPQTKFHAYGSFTFGSRTRFNPGLLNYSTEVGLNSFVHGQYGRAAAAYSAIIAGLGIALGSNPTPAQRAAGPQGHSINATGIGSVIIGWNGTNYSIDDPYKTILASEQTLCSSDPSIGVPAIRWTTAVKNGNITFNIKPQFFIRTRVGVDQSDLESGLGLEWDETHNGTTPIIASFTDGINTLPAFILSNDSNVFIQSPGVIPAGSASSSNAAFYSSDPAYGTGPIITSNLGVDQTWSTYTPQLFVGNNRDTSLGATFVIHSAKNVPVSAISLSKYAKITSTARNVSVPSGSVNVRGTGIHIQPGHFRNIATSADPNIIYGANVYISAGTSSKIGGSNQDISTKPGVVWLGMGQNHPVSSGDVPTEVSSVSIGNGTPISRLINGKVTFIKTGSTITANSSDGISPIQAGWSLTGGVTSGTKYAFIEVLFSSPLYSPNGTTVVPIINATVEYLNDSNGLTPILEMFTPFIKEVSSTGFQIGFRSDGSFSGFSVANWPIRVHFSVQSM